MHYLAEIVKHSFERSYSSETVSCLLFWPSLDSQLHPKESQNPLLNNLTQAPLSLFSTHLGNKGPLLPTDYIILFLFTSLRCRLGKHSTMELHRQTSYFCVKSPPSPRLKTEPCLLQLSRPLCGPAHSHGFICALNRWKCCSWTGHLVVNLPEGRGRWHQLRVHFSRWERAPLPHCDLQSYSQSDVFQTQCLLQLWKIFSLTSNLTINNFFFFLLFLSPPWGLAPAGMFHRRGSLPSINLSGPGGITVQLISFEWTSFLWSYL